MLQLVSQVPLLTIFDRYSRGKKIFRKFSDVEEQDNNTSIDGHDTSHDLRRRIGHAATRPLERASIKPRLLWPSKEETQQDELLEDEEAPTDIEDPDLTTSLEHAGINNSPHNLLSKPHSTRTKHQPEQRQPTSTYPSRSSHHQQNGERASSSATSRHTRRSELTDTFEDDSSKNGLVYKASPFSSWARIKSGQSSTGRTKGTKRDADLSGPSGNVADSKRARSGPSHEAL